MKVETSGEPRRGMLHWKSLCRKHGWSGRLGLPRLLLIGKPLICSKAYREERPMPSIEMRLWGFRYTAIRKVFATRTNRASSDEQTKISQMPVARLSKC